MREWSSEPGVTNLEVSDRGWRQELFLRARSFVAIGVQHRRQCGGKFRRRALPEVRIHDDACARAGSRAAGRHRWCISAAKHSTLRATIWREFSSARRARLAWRQKSSLRIVKRPECVQTLLAAFPSTNEAGAAVSDIIAAGMLPAAMEMMDNLAIQAAEAAVHANYPMWRAAAGGTGWTSGRSSKH